MKRMFGIVTAAGLLAAAPAAFAEVDVSIDIFAPAPVVSLPAPVYVAPAPVYVAPAPRVVEARYVEPHWRAERERREHHARYERERFEHERHYDRH